MKRPGIVARLVMPSVLVTFALTVTFLLAEHYWLAAYSLCSFAWSVIVLRWSWPKEDG